MHVGDSPDQNNHQNVCKAPLAVSETPAEATGDASATTTGFWPLTLGSIGVVFGDIGTSPLYAFREAVAGAAQGEPPSRTIVLGVLR